MLKYTFSFFLFLLFMCNANAQTQTQTERIRGLRLSYDFSRLALIQFDPQRTAIGFAADMEVLKHYYGTVEYGNEKVSISDSLYNYNSDGYFVKFGIDRNYLTKIRPDQYEMVFGGLRYGYAKYRHSADNILVSEGYWGDFSGGYIEPYDATAHWIELTGGIKGELFKNFFIGWNMSIRILVAQDKDSPMLPYTIPGYGYVDGRTTIGFNYWVAYRIPLYKVKTE